MAEEEEGEEEEEEEMLAAPEGLSPVYYRWLCLFVRRFCLRQATGAAGSEGGKGALLSWTLCVCVCVWGGTLVSWALCVCVTLVS